MTVGGPCAKNVSDVQFHKIPQKKSHNRVSVIAANFAAVASATVITATIVSPNVASATAVAATSVLSAQSGSSLRPSAAAKTGNLTAGTTGAVASPVPRADSSFPDKHMTRQSPGTYQSLYHRFCHAYRNDFDFVFIF